MVVPEKNSQSNIQNSKIIGTGETTLVLSHGYGADQSIWDAVLPDLTHRCRVLLFDWNFSAAVHRFLIHDASDQYSFYEALADDLVSLIDDTGLNNLVFVGHSMAGMIGCIAAARRPELFRRLVLLGASPRYLNAEGYEGGFERSDVEGIFTTMESDFTSWAESFAGTAVGGGNPDAVEKFHKSLVRMGPEVAVALARAVFLSDLREVLDSVQVPCTVISAVDDPVTPVSVAHYMQRRMRGETTVEILGSGGHFPQVTAGGSLVGALDGVLKC